jgi:NAD-dependent deacetylase
MAEIDPGDVDRCAQLIRGARTIVALTGAGISTAAGVPDFRGPQGIYVTRRYDPEKTFDIRAFRSDPGPFFEFTRDLLAVLDSLEPTFTHCFLAELEQQGKLDRLITQNIDALHERAGSRRVIAVHGGYWTSHCLGCRAAFSLDQVKELLAKMEIPRCECGEVVKPDVVFFGEAVHGLDDAVAAVANADLLLVLGSSLTVYPVAMLPQMALCEVFVVNLGGVGLTPGPRRHIVDADLDQFFKAVAERMAL